MDEKDEWKDGWMVGWVDGRMGGWWDGKRNDGRRKKSRQKSNERKRASVRGRMTTRNERLDVWGRNDKQKQIHGVKADRKNKLRTCTII